MQRKMFTTNENEMRVLKEDSCVILQITNKIEIEFTCIRDQSWESFHHENRIFNE